MIELDHAEKFRTDGFVFFPGLLPRDLLKRIQEELPKVLDEPGPQRFLEDDGTTVRAVYGLHRKEGVWQEVATDSVVSQTAKSLSNSDLYVLQWKVNPKSAEAGDQWEWHRDFTYWQAEDGLPAPRAFTAGIFLDDIDEDNGPLRIVPGSHTGPALHEELEAMDHQEITDREADDWSAAVSANLSFAISDGGATALSGGREVFTACGPAGSVVFFDSNVVHGSLPNRSRRPRTLALISYNPVDNAPTDWPTPRPAYFVNLEPTPLP
ncbi:phytanoyl-CoA dioxygenase family protein [Kitasatospora sp. NPDC057940]|uniref:phytanoyl-CoA dioxygenase family protein n=1 Tax=Kitasatospora sp. NPDC057940 TaxID=3346285 RepID=UPI0036DDDE90